MDFLAFLTAFSLLFLGELGDKTQLVIFNLALKFKEAWKLGIGATLGFALIITVGLTIGVIIEDFVPLAFVSYISGAIFLILGIWGIFNLRYEWKKPKKANNGDQLANTGEKLMENQTIEKYKGVQKNPFLAGFGFIILMEFGDKTQVITISLASINVAIFEIWCGAFLALSSLAWVGVYFGGIIAKKVPKFYIEIISSAIFCLIGLWLVINPG